MVLMVKMYTQKMCALSSHGQHVMMFYLHVAPSPDTDQLHIERQSLAKAAPTMFFTCNVRPRWLQAGQRSRTFQLHA
jgi:hypothetical protein